MISLITTRLDKISYEAGNQSDRQGGESRTQELTCLRLRPNVAQEKPGPPQKPPRRGAAWPKNAPRAAKRQLRGQSCSLINYLRQIQERPSSFAKFFTCLAGDQCRTNMSQVLWKIVFTGHCGSAGSSPEGTPTAARGTVIRRNSARTPAQQREG